MTFRQAGVADVEVPTAVGAVPALGLMDIVPANVTESPFTSIGGQVDKVLLPVERQPVLTFSLVAFFDTENAGAEALLARRAEVELIGLGTRVTAPESSITLLQTDGTRVELEIADLPWRMVLEQEVLLPRGQTKVGSWDGLFESHCTGRSDLHV